VSPRRRLERLAEDEHSALDDKADDSVGACARLEIGEHERLVATHPARIAVHDFERGADHRREVDLVDHQQVGLGDAGPPLRGILSPAATSITYRVKVGELRRERRGEVVAAAFDKHHVEVAESLRQALHRSRD
jgi:hypothetical protein